MYNSGRGGGGGVGSLVYSQFAPNSWPVRMSQCQHLSVSTESEIDMIVAKNRETVKNVLRRPLQGLMKFLPSPRKVGDQFKHAPTFSYMEIGKEWKRCKPGQENRYAVGRYENIVLICLFGNWEIIVNWEIIANWEIIVIVHMSFLECTVHIVSCMWGGGWGEGGCCSAILTLTHCAPVPTYSIHCSNSPPLIQLFIQCI